MVITDQETLDKFVKTMQMTPHALRPQKIFVTFTPRDFHGTTYYSPSPEGRDGCFDLNPIQ